MSGVFTPPSSCSSHWTYEGQAANSVTGGLLIQNAGAGHNDEPCYPPGFGGWGRAPSFIQIFSPGICPSGYTTANNNYNGQTTTAVCCLSKFGYTNFISSVNAGGKTAQFFGCTSIFTNAGPTIVFAEGDGDGITSSRDGITGMFTTVSGQITMWAQPVTVAFQQDDLSLFATSQSSTSSVSSTITSVNFAPRSSELASPASSTPMTATTTTSSPSEFTSSGSSSTSSLTSSVIKAATSQASSSSSSTGAGSSSGVSVLGSSRPTTSAAQMQSPSPGPSTGAIAGIVIGAVALLAVIIGPNYVDGCDTKECLSKKLKFLEHLAWPIPYSSPLNMEEWIDEILISKTTSDIESKTYSSRDSHVVTHRSTNLPFNCLCMAERTGCPVFS
ncbi:hypothetical protein KCU99_g9984, partial [Aureobasidium melanogenum]